MSSGDIAPRELSVDRNQLAESKCADRVSESRDSARSSPRTLDIVPALAARGREGSAESATHREDEADHNSQDVPDTESDPRLADILSLFGRGERDLLGFFMVEMFELIMEGGDQVAPVLGFASQGALRNIPHDSDAVWAYLRLADIALCHGFIENHEERLKLERSFHEVRSWTLGLAHGVGRPKSGARRWSEVAAYAQRICDKFPGLGTRTTIELS